LSYINRNHARQSGTNRTTRAEISNTLWLGFPGRVNGLYAVKPLDYFDGASEGSLSTTGPDRIQLQIPRTDRHQEVHRVYSLKPWLYF
jgi:hypothetical protein